MSPDDLWRVSHMIDAAEQALAFVQGRARSDLDADAMLQYALTRAVEVVGEAATKVSEAGRGEMPAVPWLQIVGMRNRLVHAYFSINHDVLWDTVQLALPPLLAQLKAAPGLEPDQSN
jgi:uncharacterized protein with HEPN domain